MTAPHSSQPDATGHPEEHPAGLLGPAVQLVALDMPAVGDLVALRSGGPDMTVTLTSPPDARQQWVVAAWFHGGQYIEGQFDVRTLRKLAPA